MHINVNQRDYCYFIILHYHLFKLCIHFIWQRSDQSCVVVLLHKAHGEGVNTKDFIIFLMQKGQSILSLHSHCLL